jgi:hypothetical protein
MSSRMKQVRIDPVGRTATVGAGLTQGEAVATLGARGFAIPTGSEATVGAVGATLGGGFGFLTRAFGLACDNLIGVRIVVPAGRTGARVIQANRSKHPDLLWACRGRGGGNFGIVTSLTYRLHPLSSVVLCQARWPDFSSLTAAFHAWQGSAPRTDPRLTSVFEVDPKSFQLVAVLAAGARRRRSGCSARCWVWGSQRCRSRLRPGRRCLLLSTRALVSSPTGCSIRSSSRDPSRSERSKPCVALWSEPPQRRATSGAPASGARWPAPQSGAPHSPTVTRCFTPNLAQLRSPAEDQAHLRPGQRVPLRAVDPADMTTRPQARRHLFRGRSAYPTTPGCARVPGGVQVWFTSCGPAMRG